MLRGWFERSNPIRILARSIGSRRPRAADKRRTARLWLGGEAECSLGHILDISRGGARVVARQWVEGRGLLKLEVDGTPLVIESRVVWCRRRGFRTYEVGLEFLGVTEEAGQLLSRLAAA